MGHTNINNSGIKGPYKDVRKDKNVHAPSGQQQQTANRNNKYGSWGPVYKTKQNFIEMHTC